MDMRLDVLVGIKCDNYKGKLCLLRWNIAVVHFFRFFFRIFTNFLHNKLGSVENCELHIVFKKEGFGKSVNVRTKSALT